MQKFILFLVCALGVLVGIQVMDTSSSITNDVLLTNVEALANGESNLPTYCEFVGDCVCPNGGIKVKYVIESYGLEADEETY